MSWGSDMGGAFASMLLWTLIGALIAGVLLAFGGQWLWHHVHIAVSVTR